MFRRAKCWALSHVAVLVVGVAGFSVVPPVLGVWWFAAFFLAMIFTLVMTRQCISEDARIPDEIRRRWDLRLPWLGPVAVLYLVLFGVGRAEE